jgi:hypothetical protein
MANGELDQKDLLAFLIHRADALARDTADEERQSEERIKFFMSIAGGAIGLVGLFLRNEWFGSGDKWFPIVLGTLIVLLLFGLQTLNRLNWRYIHRTKSHRLWLNIMDVCCTFFPQIHSHMKMHKLYENRFNTLPFIPRKLRGSPAEFMYLANGLIIAGLWLSFGIRYSWEPYTMIQVSLLGLASMFVQCLYCWCVREKALTKRNPSKSN